MCRHIGSEQARHTIRGGAGGDHDLLTFNVEAFAGYTHDLSATPRDSGDRGLIAYLHAELARCLQVPRHGGLVWRHAAVR